MAFENLIDTSVWVLIHGFTYGETAYFFTAHTEPEVNEVLANQLGIDYTPDNNEALILYRLPNLNSLPHIET